MLLALLACTDYEFKKSANDPQEPDFEPETDQTWVAAPEDSGAPPVDTANTPPPDTGTADACYEPEDGYSSNPAARFFVTTGGTPITVTFVSSSTSYQDVLRLDSPDTVHVADAWTEASGTTTGIGPYPAETELMFGILVNNTGDHFYQGPAARNADGVEHVALTYEGGCSWLIGFEDLYGGGDRDFNDVVLRVQGMLRQED